MELANYEYTVAQKSEGKWSIYRWLMLSGYVLFAAGYFIAAYLSGFIPLVAILPLLLWILVYFTYRYVKPEYKYEISEAYLKFYRIYGKKAKEVTRIRICDADFIIPLESAITEIQRYSPSRTYSAIPSKDSADLKNDSKDACAFMFKATAEALKCLKFYNGNTVITDTDL